MNFGLNCQKEKKKINKYPSDVFLMLWTLLGSGRDSDDIILSVSTSCSGDTWVLDSACSYERPRLQPLFYGVGSNPHEWVKSCYCLSK